MIPDPKPRRILLMYITKVSGHRQATVAVKKALKQVLPDSEILSINGFEYTYPILEKVVNRAYMGVIKRVPKIWDMMYDNPKLVKRSASIKNLLHKISHRKLNKLFKEFKPDTVVCTQAFPCGMVAHFKKSQGLDITLIGVLTDHAPHAYWLNEGVDYYVVPSEDAKERFMKEGVPEERIKVLGIPIRLKFAQPTDRKTLAEGLGLAPQTPTVLVMGGGQGLGPIQHVVKALLEVPTALQMIVIAGTNRKLVAWLSEIAPRSSKKMIRYEYANNVDELMSVADLIITKPGGMTTSEALAKGLPMVIVNPIPGQEMYNTEFLLRKGIAIRIDDVDAIGREVENLINDPQRLNAMSRAALAHGRPWAALDVAKLIAQSTPEPVGGGI